MGVTTPTPRTAGEIVITAVGFDELDCSRSDAAQQASACAWVTTRAEPDSPERPLCIGHSRSSAQHAIRSSAVAAHPAHTAALPAARASVSSKAGIRWDAITRL